MGALGLWPGAYHAGGAPDVCRRAVPGSYQHLDGAVLPRLDVLGKVLMLRREGEERRREVMRRRERRRRREVMRRKEGRRKVMRRKERRRRKVMRRKERRK